MVFLTFYFGLVSIIIGTQTNSDPAPGRSPGPPGIDSQQNNHDNIEETSTLVMTKEDNSHINHLDDSHNIVDKLNFEYMSIYEKNKNINAKLDMKLPSKCQDKFQNFRINKNNRIYKKLTDTQFEDIFKFDVIHDVFDTNKGLICGLMYKVRLEVVSPNKLKSFIVETVSQDGISIGNFVKYNLDSQLPLSWIQARNYENILQDTATLKDDASDCSNNIWTDEFHNKSAAIAFWISNQFYDSVNATEFRIYLRLSKNTTDQEEDIFLQKTISIKLKKECSLWLKNSTGIVDYTFLPLYSIDCKIHFPSYDEVSFPQPPEFLIKLNRLNIPCDSGSYIQFSGKQKICGKLEELNENELTYHFNIHENISIRIYKKAMFNFQYNLVDYCYNKSVTQMNATFFVKPIRDSLECHIKIHLPYGNKINVTIITNYANNELINDVDDIDIENVLQNNYFSNNVTNNLDKLNNNNNSSLCDGIFITIIEDNYIQWHNCVQENNEMKKISYISTSNILIIHAKKYSILEKYGDIILNTKILPSVLLTYKFESIPEIVADCAFGWISLQQFCVTTVETAMSWEDGEEYCSNIGGHLASIRTESNQKLIDEMIKNSPRYQKYFAYWIGGSDTRFEGDYKWSDGLPFQYTNWFPGWSRHNNYNKQPNDDGLSNQDCIELRKYFRTPPGIHQSTTVPFSESFMWNDRDCNAKNYIVCESEMSDYILKSSWLDDCNKTVALTKESPKASIWSPSFPRQYPDNANCYTTITAPNGYKIVIEFEELVIESEPGCSYDFLEITEPTVHHENDQKNKKYISGNVHKRNNYRKRNFYEHSNNYEFAQTNYQNLLNIFSVLYKPHINSLIRTPNYPKGNILYPTNISKENLPKRICGDWSSKLKLLRYVSRNSYVGFHFVSDYSHNFGGFKAKVFMENRESECPDDRLMSFNSSCYLFVSYPEVDWWTAQQICKGMGAQLSSVATSFEHKFITTSIRNQADYTPQVLYWLGAEYVHSGEFKWTDNTKMTFQGWLPGEEKFGISFTDSTCLGLQWKKASTPIIQSGLYWESAKCRRLGGYICKKSQPQYKYFELMNETVSGTEGRLTSPGYPGLYPPNTDYWIHIVAAARSRIIVQFQKIDLEPQDECLYDFISIQNYDRVSKILLEPGINIVPMAMLKSEENMENNKYESERMHFLRRTKRSNSNDRLRHNILEIIKYNRQVKSFSRINSRRKRQIKWRNMKTKSKRDIVGQYEKSSPSFLPYVRWCGQHDSNMSKFDFVSISNEITINFHSDYSISGLGFAALWKTVDMSGCPKQSLTSREGIVSSPNYPHFLINNIDCTYVIQAPSGKKVWLEFKDFDILEETVVYIDIGHNTFQPYVKKNHINEGIFVSLKEQIKIQIKTAQKPRGRGFQAIYKTVGSTIQERILQLSNISNGYLYHLNYPERVPENIYFKQHLIAPLGDIILLEIYDVEFSEKGCANRIEVFDYYADNNGTKWILCKNTNNQNSLIDKERKSNNFDYEVAPVHITSYLNTIHILQTTSDNSFLNFNATIRIQEDMNYKYKLTLGDELIESCQPDPCLHRGKCKANGNKVRCQCYSHFTGRFCALNLCELEPCVFGKCELTANNFKCHCQPGYIGLTCDQKQNPCADNPCEGRGECFVKNGEFTCRCHAWWEGRKCERRMLHIPYKPLSERMLQEPFWLGLITVFVVLAFIGLVWCAKRHFPEKIEKLLAEEADRNRPSGSVHGHHHTSLREQLQFTSSIPHGTTINLHGPSRSIFNRLGIRKPSLLSLSSPNPSAGATARTFSLDDLLQPLPRRSPSPRKKRNNSTPVKKNAAEKKQILQQLISPIIASSTTKLNIGELIQMTENNIKEENTQSFQNEPKETTFLNPSTTAPRLLSDPKLEKKVTFARLLNKVSAEMSSEIEHDNGMKFSTANSFPAEVIFLPNSVPTSPSTNDIHLPSNSKSNPGSDSLSSSDIALTDASSKNSNLNNYKENNKKIRPKTSSADSILAMFRNFASASGGGSTLSTSSVFVSPSTTPTPSSPQDDVPGDDDSSTSSMHTPISLSSGPPDSPLFYRATTIDVPVLDVINSNKTIPNTNLLHPPTVLLEIPSNGINKCLSPIRELPTPIPSPALTPIMPRLHRAPNTLEEDSCAVEDYEKMKFQTSVNDMTTNYAEINHFVSEINTFNSAGADYLTEANNKAQNSKHNSTFPSITIELNPPTPGEKTLRPRNLVIPTLLLEQPSPTKNGVPMILFPGSPPPQRAVIIDETSFIFPKKQQQNSTLKQFDKSTSLDLSIVPPTITLTSNVNEQKPDTNSIVSNTNLSGTSILLPENSAGMCYLSPFAMCNRSDRTISESNLSSSGYSSMASPGPSRCSSSNPLCPNEMEEPGTTQSGSNFTFHSCLLNKRQSSILSIFKESVSNNNQIRLRSDSDTLSDDAILESNDEGIGTDHIDEKHEDIDVSKINGFQINTERDIVLSGSKKLNTAGSPPMAQLQLPLITVQNEGKEKGLSPVSSRSESPLSERAGMCRFSSHFYGKKDQQLPFTDSDGLYDFPSSDGKGASHTHTHPRRSSSKKRDRKSTKVIPMQSPTKSQLDLPTNDSLNRHASSKHFHSHYQAGNISSRKSPKRRQRIPVASSSSSTESLTSARELTIRMNKRLQTPKRENHGPELELDKTDDDTNQTDCYNVLPDIFGEQKVKIKSKSSRLKAIGNQIRFLRRLEKSIKSRGKLQSSECSPDDENNEELNSLGITYPLLCTTVDNQLENTDKKCIENRNYGSVTIDENNYFSNKLRD